MINKNDDKIDIIWNKFLNDYEYKIEWVKNKKISCSV